MNYALCIMNYALCIMNYALRIMHYELPSPFHQDEEDVDVAWRYAWDS